MDTKYWKEIGLGGLLGGSLATLIVVYFLFYKPQTSASEKLKKKTYTRAFTLWGRGNSGNLSCPGNKKIKINRGTYMCALNSTGEVDDRCDPFFTNGNYNPATTFDAKIDLENECNGKSSCTFRLPNVYETGENECDCGFQNVVLNASYYCVPAEPAEPG